MGFSVFACAKPKESKTRLELKHANATDNSLVEFRGRASRI
jgi:hypothetical protein